MSEDTKTEDPTLPEIRRINAYTCEAGHQLVTVDRQNGVTPFIIGCRRSGCKEPASSSFYRVGQDLTPTYEWYRPSFREYETLDAYAQGHVRNGGLLLREIKPDREVEIPMSDELLAKMRPTFVIDSLGPTKPRTPVKPLHVPNRFKKRKKNR